MKTEGSECGVPERLNMLEKATLKGYLNNKTKTIKTKCRTGLAETFKSTVKYPNSKVDEGGVDKESVWNFGLQSNKP